MSGSNTNTGSYDALVNNGVAKIGPADTWRHMVSIVFLHSDGDYYRLSVRKLLHAQRCLNCVMTNKCRGFCFAKVNDKDSSINSTTLQSLIQWAAAEYDDRGEEVAEVINLIVDETTIFPELAVLKVTKGNKRIPMSHTLPCVAEIFGTNDPNFLSFLTVSMFEHLCCERQSISSLLMTDMLTDWFEPNAIYKERVVAFHKLKNIPWSDARDSLKELVELQWKQWKNEVNCTKTENKCAVGGCSCCKFIKTELSKRFRHLVRRGFEERLTKMLKDRTGFCKDTPHRFEPFYRDTNVRIVKLQFSAGAAARGGPNKKKPSLRATRKRTTLRATTRLFKPPTDARFMCDNVDVEEI